MKIKLAIAAFALTALSVACVPEETSPEPAPVIEVLPSCRFEDGSGQGPCVWTHPDTGQKYRNN